MNFYQTITAAINDVVTHGFDSQSRIDRWVRAIKKSARASMVSPRKLEQGLRAALTTIYIKMVEKSGVVKYHPGVPLFMIKKLTPAMRAELSRRIDASADLIRLNRETMIAATERRFRGWSSSVPKGGSKAQDKPEVKESVRKPLVSLPFEERRVLIDQGHKLVSSINDVVAKGSGAIAMTWHSHWRQKNYDYREDHKERDELVYLIRGNWAQQKGLVKPGPAGYLDEITQPAEEPFCRCYGQYIYSVDALPAEMLTAKGKSELERVEKELAA